jgi:hypothetical protein
MARYRLKDRGLTYHDASVAQHGASVIAGLSVPHVSGRTYQNGRAPRRASPACAGTDRHDPYRHLD